MPSHITITPITDPVTVEAGGLTLGRSQKALELREGSYPPVIYVPREDIDMGLLEKSARTSGCPWKGQASYFSILAPGGTLTDAVWSYEVPNFDVAAIAGHLAFYPDRVHVTRG
jgi:uncharacterized protein (DUF427 family)